MRDAWNVELNHTFLEGNWVVDQLVNMAMKHDIGITQFFQPLVVA